MRCQNLISKCNVTKYMYLPKWTFLAQYSLSMSFILSRAGSKVQYWFVEVVEDQQRKPEPQFLWAPNTGMCSQRRRGNRKVDEKRLKDRSLSKVWPYVFGLSIPLPIWLPWWVPGLLMFLLNVINPAPIGCLVMIYFKARWCPWQLAFGSRRYHFVT